MAIQHDAMFVPRSRLVEARNDNEWSQRDLAERIGTTYVNVSRWERGLTKPSPYFRRKLCTLFNKSEEELDLGPPRREAAPDLAIAPVSRTPATSPLSHILPTFPFPTQPPPAQLLDPLIPQRSTPNLIGRATMLASLQQRLCTGTPHDFALTALNGLPGVGKTALSIALAHDATVRAHFHGGILWAGLGPEPNLPKLLSHWGTLLGITMNEGGTLHDNEAWAQALNKAIGTRKILLVLDDAWAVEHALALKVGGPNCAHLVTTRFPTLALQIAPTGSTTLQELTEAEGMDLLEQLAPNVVPQEQQRASQLVKAVGGLPLALTLMGKYLHVQSHSKQPRRIRATLERLNDVEQRLHLTGQVGPNEKHTSLPAENSLSLQSVISVTDALLDPQTQRALYALSVFPAKPDNFSEEAALAVMDAPIETLDTLGDMGLLESSATGRYTLHQTIADYARTRLRQGRDEHSVYARYIDYTLAYIAAHRKDYELLEQEMNVIMAALDAAHTLHMPRQLVQGVCAFAPYLLMRGFYDLANGHLQRALAAAQAQHDAHGHASTLLYLGEIAQKQGVYALAESRFKEGLALARSSHNTERISALLNDLGWVTWKQGNYTLAEAHLKEGLALARQLNDDERVCSILKTLGSVVGSQGDYTKEKAYLQEGLIIARRLKDDEQICIFLINLGVTVGEQGKHLVAEEYFLEGLEIARIIGHREWESALLSNLGGAASEQENYKQAEFYFQEGLIVANQIGHREWVSLLLLNLGMTTRKQSKYDQAKSYLEEGLALCKQLDIPQMTSNALYEYGSLYLDQQQIEGAEKIFQEMFNSVPIGGQDLLALAQYGLARTIAVKGNTYEAKILGEKSVLVLEALGHRGAKEVRNWLNIITT